MLHCHNQADSALRWAPIKAVSLTVKGKVTRLVSTITFEEK